ncbi:UDP-galactose transporter senju [Halyomorpha halys]|uniref:UDP-galactose transporter senju n=1 Tax=Halyomorpha halys TaxID=286706 RepID=UPI0006D505ED|nr:UDP-galactose transporter senju [Halyomorpha halys]
MLGFFSCLEMFPSKWSLWLFLLYITLFVNQGWLVTKSQKSDNKYNYDTEIAVFLTEGIKLFVCIVGYSFQHGFLSIVSETSRNTRVAALYFVPAGLYCIYNNLSYINLSTFDPTTYFLALQLRVVATGVVFQVIFNKKLSGKQWFSLVLLTAGCMLKVINFGDAPVEIAQQAQGKQLSLSASFSSMLLLLQVACSCLAGVYNEYLLKSHSENLSLYLQNIFQYLDSIICIVIILTFGGNINKLFDHETYVPFNNIKVFLVIFNNAAIGIVTSFFLRYLNSILKTFASGLELVFTAILSRVLFSIPIYLNTVLSIFVVTVATVIYSQNPVSTAKVRGKEDREKLLEKSESIV